MWEKEGTENRRHTVAITQRLKKLPGISILLEFFPFFQLLQIWDIVTGMLLNYSSAGIKCEHNHVSTLHDNLYM